MDSSLDIFGRAVGLAYTLLTPIVGYFLLRTFAPLRMRDIALGVFGFVDVALLARTPVSFAAFALAGRLLAEWNSPPSEFVKTFVYGFCYYGAFALVKEAACILLLSHFGSRRHVTAPAFGYAIGAAGAYCVVLANHEFYYLQSAWVENGDYSSARAFLYGIPQGASAGYHLLIEVILVNLVWRGIVEKKNRLIVGAVLLDVGLTAISVLLTTLVPRTPYFVYDSAFGLTIALSYFWAPPVLRLSARLPRLRKSEPVIESDGSVRVSLLSTWRKQRWRSD